MIRVAITKGWGNVDEIFVESSVSSEADAYKWVEEYCPDPEKKTPWCGCSMTDGGTVVDYGSHFYFGFIFKEGRE